MDAKRSFRALLLLVAVGAMSSPVEAAVVDVVVEGPGGVGAAFFHHHQYPHGSKHRKNRRQKIAIKKKFKAVDYIDLVVTVDGPGKYIFAEGLWGGVVFNATGTDWTDYHLELIPAEPNDGLRFFGALSTSFDDVQVMEDAIWMEDGLVPDGEYGKFIFGVLVGYNVPWQPAIQDVLCETYTYTFTIRQFPTTTQVPEPGTLALMSVGMIGMVAIRRRRSARADCDLAAPSEDLRELHLSAGTVP